MELKSERKESAAWHNGSKCRFYGGHGRKADGSIPAQAFVAATVDKTLYDSLIVSAW